MKNTEITEGLKGMNIKTINAQEGTHSLLIHKPKATGKFCFQFDEDKIYEICEIVDNQEINLKLSSPAAKEGEEPKDSEINFEKGGKKFRIFIKAI